MAEGQFPKADGDVSYASEVNKIFFFEYGKEFCGDGSDGALSVTSGTTTLTGNSYQYSSISVSNGATLTFSGKGKVIVKCQGDCAISGNLNLPTRTGDAPTTFDGFVGGSASESTGGTAGASFPVIIARLPFLGFCLTEGGSGSAGATATGNAAGGGGAGGGSYGAGGAGGNGGGGRVTGNGAGGAAGAGKGTVVFYIQGNITIAATAVISGAGTTGGNGSAGSVNGGGGGGGGAGGFLYMSAGGNATLASGAAISVNGGNGGTGANGTLDGGGGNGGSGGGGGGGGGGGLAYIICSGTLSNSATITATKGNGGAAGTGTFSNGAAGSNGVDGLVSVLARPFTIS